ncbi:MAG: iron-sulfur cluster assembly scaffold protein [Candidatus Poribacteria bacterium]|nr:iron-sulfur cluster assembly scaffold protein [Candidatus Poribacteria bacterium]
MHTPQVTEHFENPRNIGTIDDADGTATIGSAASGEMLKLTLKISNGAVVAAKFKAFGCPTAIASGSVLTELVTGSRISDALKITASHISKALGGLPADKQRYATYAEKVLKTAIENSLSKQETHQ